jgi:hypothetical protein
MWKVFNCMDEWIKSAFVEGIHSYLSEVRGMAAIERADRDKRLRLAGTEEPVSELERKIRFGFQVFTPQEIEDLVAEDDPKLEILLNQLNEWLVEEYLNELNGLSPCYGTIPTPAEKKMFTFDYLFVNAESLPRYHSIYSGTREERSYLWKDYITDLKQHTTKGSQLLSNSVATLLASHHHQQIMEDRFD